MSRDDETTKKPSSGDDDDRALDQRITAYLRVGVPIGTLACATAAAYAQGASAAVLVLSAGALVAAIAIFWASIRTLVGETPLSGADAYALGAPRAEEEQKRAVLRALKDLEFERSVGKISEEDYQALVAKYRAEAKRLLRALDEESQPERAKVEALVAKRLRREGLAAGAAAERAKPAPAADAGEERAAPKAKPKAGTKIACADCGTRNDADAVFCKKCGARQGEGDEDDVADRPGNEEASS